MEAMMMSKPTPSSLSRVKTLNPYDWATTAAFYRRSLLGGVALRGWEVNEVLCGFLVVAFLR
jgi:hypothetical protein